MTTTVIAMRDAPRGWEANDQFVYIGRAGRGHDGYFGNPFPLQPGEARGATLQRYTVYLLKRMSSDDAFRAAIYQLAGKTLVCFCRPNACHGDVIAAELDHHSNPARECEDCGGPRPERGTPLCDACVRLAIQSRLDDVAQHHEPLDDDIECDRCADALTQAEWLHDLLV